MKRSENATAKPMALETALLKASPKESTREALLVTRRGCGSGQSWAIAMAIPKVSDSAT